jgi:hypothetical protein
MPHLSIQSLQEKTSSLPNLSHAARSVGFLKRASKKITPQNFLLTCCLFALQARGSFSTFATFWFDLVGQTLSKQAVAKRFSAAAVQFMETVLQQVILSLVGRPRVNASSLRFHRILIHDSTCLKLHQKLAGLFPGSVNQAGQSGILKIQGCIDLLKGCFISFGITPYTRNDQTAAGDILSLLKKGDLLIRDLGYHVTEVFKQIDQLSAFFLSRMRLDCHIYSPTTGQRINLLQMLKGLTQWDGAVLFSQEKLPLRLVAVRLPQAVGNERRRKQKADKGHRYTQREDVLRLLDWNILITNIPKHQCDLTTLFKLYALRWRIEIIFKTWKSHFNLNSLDQKCSLNQVLLTVLGKLVWICWFCVHFTALVEQGYSISILKLAQWWKQFSTKLFLLSDPDEANLLLKGICYYCRYEKRKKRKNHLELLWELSLG